MALKDTHIRPLATLLLTLLGMLLLLNVLLFLNAHVSQWRARDCRQHGHSVPGDGSAAAGGSAAQLLHAADGSPDGHHLLRTSDWTFPGVAASARSEADSLLTPRCNASFVRQHPLREADYERAYRPGGTCSMPPGVLHKLRTGRPVRITVVGGSMTAGAACIDGDRMYQQCAWPARMRDRLQQVFPAANISLHNAAKHSYSYTSWLESGMLDGLVDTDVLLVDLTINSQVYKFDAFYQMQEVDEFLFGVLSAAQRRQQQEQQQQLPGVLFVESFLTCGNFSALCDAHCGSPTRQGSLTTSIEGFNTTIHWCNRYYTMADMERPIVQHYGLPVASYRSAVWPSMAHPPATLPCFSNGFSHPDPIGHFMFGDVVSYGLVRALMDAERRGADTYAAECGVPARQAAPLRKFHAQMPSVRYCLPPTAVAAAGGGGATFMTAARPEGFTPLRAGSWLWRADRPNKPGWIFDPAFNGSGIGRSSPAATVAGGNASNAGNTSGGSSSREADDASIWFRVAFSARPQLQVTYLTSYERLGAAELSIHPAAGTAAAPGGFKFDNSTALAGYLLDPIIKERYSIPRTSILVHPGAAAGAAAGAGGRTGRNALRLPSSVGAGEYVVALRPVAVRGRPVQKFKLLGVASC